ncbi:MAG: hypothetical protein E6Q97_28090 [Desulfurellales bacterium]|nr:MAG: hypothetical protein E6Q97_28090 [Desulfurellales bacterium]
MSLFDEEDRALRERAASLDLRVIYQRGRPYPVVLDEHDVEISDDLLWDLDYARRRLASDDYEDRTPPEREPPTHS